MDEQEALAILSAMIAIPGALKIITNEVRPELRQDPEDPSSPVREDVEAADPNILKKVSTFVLHNGVALEGPNHKGQVAVHSAEGDWTMGQPSAVLARLTEWNKA
jgi:hypothetical protein